VNHEADYDKRTAMHLAVGNSRNEVLHYLIGNHETGAAAILHKDFRGETAFSDALRGGN